MIVSCIIGCSVCLYSFMSKSIFEFISNPVGKGILREDWKNLYGASVGWG